MLNLRKLVRREPLALLAVLWPLALLAPVAPWLPKPSTGGLPWRQELVLGLLLVLTIWLYARKASRARNWRLSLRRDEMFVLLPLVGFVLWSAASVLWAVNVTPALHHTFLWATYLLFFIFTSRAIRSPRVLRASILTLGVVTCIISIACIVEFWGSSALLLRSSTGLGEPLAVALPIFTVLALKLRRGRAALFCGATAVLAWLAMLQSLERAPAIGACVALAVIAGGTLISRRFRPYSLRRAITLVLFLGAAVALQTVPSPATENRPSAFTRLQTTSTEDPNTRVRFLCWAVGVEMWRDHPLSGVGAGNYDLAFPEARAQFSANNPDSPLIKLNEELLVERAHNEYVQILAELGTIGFALFIAFALVLIMAAWRGLRRTTGALVLGAASSLIAFALSSGASSVSFRWMGSGLVFFFSAAMVQRFASTARAEQRAYAFSPVLVRASVAMLLVCSLLVFIGRGVQATSSVFRGMAETATSATDTERYFRAALSWDPYDASTHFNFGVWLYLQKRPSESIPHLRFASEYGMNASVCYAYLAAAEAGTGDYLAAERTLAYAVRVYPLSVFLRVRHATAFAEAGDVAGANEEYRIAVELNPRHARGWRQLICFGRNAAKTAAFYDKGVAMPGELRPENGIFAVLDENERRQPVAVIEEYSGVSLAQQ